MIRCQKNKNKEKYNSSFFLLLLCCMIVGLISSFYFIFVLVFHSVVQMSLHVKANGRKGFVRSFCSFSSSPSCSFVYDNGCVKTVYLYICGVWKKEIKRNSCSFITIVIVSSTGNRTLPKKIYNKYNKNGIRRGVFLFYISYMFVNSFEVK